ncbi:MAG: SIS domain-containing protein [Candidatus Omnitrophota bacterium]|jgi:D-sedoheptulose 7-phosphate isomerase
MIRETYEAVLRGHDEAFQHTFRPAQLDVLEAMTREVLNALKSGKKILLCGNGGSAADAQHMAAEFVVRFVRNRKALPAIALTADTSTLTAAANDFDFRDVFSRQVEALGQPGDVLIAISTSGKSANVLRAAEQAKLAGMTVLAFTGASGGPLAESSNFCFKAQSPKTAHIQEMHITALHGLAQVVEDVLFG